MSAFSDLMAIAPKVALHDHLDGGLRAATVFELASDLGLPLPASDAAGLAIWFYEAADSGSLPRYLETFGLTVAVMLSADNLRRVAREAVEDLASDGVVYAEFRWAPEQHLSGGLTMLDAVRAVADGLDEGMREASEQGRRIEARQLLTTLRQGPPTLDTADLVLQTADLGVVGFDLAGPEAGFPASRHADAVAHVLRHGGHVTIHAGEGDGPASIADALDCGAERIGHGVRLIEDFTPQAGPTARRVLDYWRVLVFGCIEFGCGCEAWIPMVGVGLLTTVIGFSRVVERWRGWRGWACRGRGVRRVSGRWRAVGVLGGGGLGRLGR